MGCDKCRAHMCDDDSPHKPVTSTRWLCIIRLGLRHCGGAFRRQNMRVDATPMCKHTPSPMQVPHRTLATCNVPICNWSGSNRCDRACRYRARALAPPDGAWGPVKLEIKVSLWPCFFFVRPCCFQLCRHKLLQAQGATRYVEEQALGATRYVKGERGQHNSANKTLEDRWPEARSRGFTFHLSLIST